MTYTDADRAEALARSDRYAGAEERRANHRDAIAAALAAVRAEERAAIAAYIAGPVAAYDRASEQWQKANAEQDDAPSVKDAERYSDALENVAHSFVAALRYLVDGTPLADHAARLAHVSDTAGAAGHLVEQWAASPAEYGDLVAGATPAEDVERFRAWNANRGPFVVGDRSAELRVLRAAERNETRVVYVVNWTPEGVGGFEWRRTREEAAAVLVALADPTARVHLVELPDEVGDDPEGITAWLDSEGWSDGGDPRVDQAGPAAAYVLHYTSADAPGDAATWSVYRERYASRDHDEPIDGSQEHVSTHRTEAEADAEARRLQASANA